MARIVATLKTIFVAEVSQHNAAIQSAGKEVDTFVSKDAKVEATTKKASDSIKKQADSVENLRRKTEAAHISLTSFATILTTAATVPLALFGKAAFDAAVKMDSLMRGLRAVSGSAEAAEAQLKELHEIAKLPGLGFTEAVQGAVKLEAAGLSARQAGDSLKYFGNALATVGKGKADLDGVTLALSQIAAKGKVMGQDINQLSERVPQIRQAMIAAFGTADTEILQKAKITATEFIDGVNRTLKKLPQITDGIQNDLENASDAVQAAFVRIGNAILPVASKLLDVLVPAIEKASKWFEELPKSTQLWMFALAGLVAASGPLAGAIQLVSELTKALQEARLAILGPVGIIAALTLLAGFSVAGLINKNSDEGAKRAGENAITTLTERAKQLRAQILGVQENLASHKNDDMTSMLFGPINKKNYENTIAELKGLQEELAKTKKTIDMMANSQARVDAAAGTKATLEKAAVQGRIDAAARAKAMEDAKKAAKEAARAAAAFAKEREKAEADAQEQIRKYTQNTFDYKISSANKEYKEMLAKGVDRKTAEKWLSLEIATIWTKEGEDHQKAIDEWEKSWVEAEKTRVEATKTAQEEIARLTLSPAALKLYDARQEYAKNLKDKLIPKGQAEQLFSLKVGAIASEEVLKSWHDWIKVLEDIAKDGEEAAKAMEPFTDEIKRLNTEIALLNTTDAKEIVALNMTQMHYKDLTKDVQAYIDTIVKLQKTQSNTEMAKSLTGGMTASMQAWAKSLQGTIDALPADAKRHAPDAFTQFAMDFSKDFIRNTRDIGRTFIKNLLSSDPKARKDAIQNLMKELQNAFATTLSDALAKNFQPIIKSIGDQLAKALTDAAQGLQVSVLQAVTYVYGLLAAIGAQGKKQQTGSFIGAALGLGAALLTGGAVLPFVGAGAALGGAVASGNPAQIGLATLGIFDQQGGIFSKAPGNSLGYNKNEGSSRAVNVNYHGAITVNEKSDIDALARATASRLQQAALATG